MQIKSRISASTRFATFSVITGILMLCSCLKAPLGNPATSKVDPDIVGYWNQTESDGSGTLYAVAPFDEKAYIVQAYNYKKNGDEYTGKSSCWKAWVTPIKSSKFITMEQNWALINPKGPEGSVYPTAKYVVAADSLEVTPLKPEYSKFTGADTSEKITRIIQDNVADPEMFVTEVMKFRRLNPDAEPDSILIRSLIN